MTTEELEIWTIYDHPLDYPGQFVARAHAIHPGRSEPTGQVIFCDELEPLRALMREHGRTCVARHPTDEPQIVESWL